MAGKGIDARWIGDAAVRGLDLDLVAVRPRDRKPLPGEQAFVIGDEFGQALERRGRLQHTNVLVTNFFMGGSP
jgi:hypothetical protein